MPGLQLLVESGGPPTQSDLISRLGGDEDAPASRPAAGGLRRGMIVRHPDRSKLSGRALRPQPRDQIGEPVTLDDDVAPERLGRPDFVSGDDGSDDRFVFGE